MRLECIGGSTRVHSVIGNTTVSKTVFLGSSPSGPAGVVAQSVRAPDCHSGGCGFEPRQFRLPKGALYETCLFE